MVSGTKAVLVGGLAGNQKNTLADSCDALRED